MAIQFQQSKTCLSQFLIKIGSDSVTEHNLETLAKVIKYLDNRLVIVSSGAMMMDKKINKSAHNNCISKQAGCARGQVLLMNLYSEVLGKHGIKIGQVLLTSDDLNDKKRLTNIKNTLDELINESTIPIINENDTIATDEITFSDNDLLAGQISKKLGYDLIIVTTNGGIINYETNQLIKEINYKDAYKYLTKTKTKNGTGGMDSKLKACEIAKKKILITSFDNLPLTIKGDYTKCTKVNY